MADSIPDRTFVDDHGRTWEWCGGQDGTWAWRITDLGQHAHIAAIQDCIVNTLNQIAEAIGTERLTVSPVPDADIAKMLNDLSTQEASR